HVRMMIVSPEIQRDFDRGGAHAAGLAKPNLSNWSDHWAGASRSCCHFCVFGEYRVSGGCWSFLVGIRYPSQLTRKYSLPMVTQELPSMQLIRAQFGYCFVPRLYVLSTVQGRVKARSNTVITLCKRFGLFLSRKILSLKVESLSKCRG